MAGDGLNHDGAAANHNMRPDRNTRQDGGSDADLGVGPHVDLSAEVGAGGDMGMITERTVMIDRAGGVEDDVGADRRPGVDHDPGHHHGSRAKGDIRADYRRGVDHGVQVATRIENALGRLGPQGVIADGDHGGNFLLHEARQGGGGPRDGASTEMQPCFGGLVIQNGDNLQGVQA